MSQLGTWTLIVGGSLLADTSAIVEPDGEVRGGPNIMPILGYGAAAPVFLNLGNPQIVRSFLVIKEFATDTLAENFRQTAQATWSGVATVEIEHIDYESNTTTWTFVNAKVEITVPQRIGPAVIFRITITSGT